MREGIVFGLLHCFQWFLSETLCAEALGATQCSLHQSSNEAVATLAPALIEPRTNSLPGGSVFQSTGPPSRLPSILPEPPPPSPLQPLYNSVWDTQKRFPLRYMADEVRFEQERKCVSSMWQQKERTGLCLEIYHRTSFAVAVLKRNKWWSSKLRAILSKCFCSG